MNMKQLLFNLLAISTLLGIYIELSFTNTSTLIVVYIKNISIWLSQNHTHFNSSITFHYFIDCLLKADNQRYC